MDYNLVLSALQRASLFDLFRLRAAIEKLMDDPARLIALKQQVRPGMAVSFFDERKNRLTPVRILEVRQTRATVQDLETDKLWEIPLYTLNVQGANPDLARSKSGVDRLSLKIGETVGFMDRDGRELAGTVIKLNPKRAKIKTSAGVWAVPYSMLHTVIDGELVDNSPLLARR